MRRETGDDQDEASPQKKVKNYPNRIKEWMEHRNISDFEMGELIHKHHNTIFKVWRGDRIATPYEYLIPMAAVLGCNIEDLLLPSPENWKLFEALRTSKETSETIRNNVTAAFIRWTKKCEESER